MKTIAEPRTKTLTVNEIYHSIQGESTWAGLPCVFVRLTFCDLRCSYCDTAYAFYEGEKKTVPDIVAEVLKFNCPLIEITGGEPLLQKNVLPLMTALTDAGKTVLLETSGAHDISEVDPRVFPVRAIKNVRAPGARIFTSDQWGDYLIYRLYPEIQVFVDGRSDFYGAAHEQLCQDVWNVRYGWEQKLARFRVDTLLVPAETPLAGALKESRRWRIDYDDGLAIVFRAAGGEQVSGLAASRRPENQQLP